jgi:hypothetical protein
MVALNVGMIGFTFLTCKQCKNKVKFVFKMSDMEKYKAGLGHVQDLFPYTPIDIREMLLSGYCGRCYDKICENMEE